MMVLRRRPPKVVLSTINLCSFPMLNSSYVMSSWMTCDLHVTNHIAQSVWVVLCQKLIYSSGFWYLALPCCGDDLVFVSTSWVESLWSNFKSAPHDPFISGFSPYHLECGCPHRCLVLDHINEIKQDMLDSDDLKMNLTHSLFLKISHQQTV